MAEANRCDNCHEYEGSCLCYETPCPICNRVDSQGGCESVETCLDSLRSADEHKAAFERELEAGLHPGWSDEPTLGMGRTMPTAEQVAEAFREAKADLEGE